jgi:hypothetical protein
MAPHPVDKKPRLGWRRRLRRGILVVPLVAAVTLAGQPPADAKVQKTGSINCKGLRQ